MATQTHQFSTVAILHNMKLFKTNNMDIVKYCQYCFDFEMPSELWAKRVSKLNEKNR